MHISACYIVKDEAGELRRSLRSICKGVDDILIVHTGHSGEIKHIAQAYQTGYSSYEWQDDFAAARNHALSLLPAEADWVVFLDADEYLSEETASHLRDTVEQHQNAQVLLLPWLNIDKETGELLLSSYAPRIFRLAGSPAYVGRIHEELRYGGKAPESVIVVQPTELNLIHTGYSKTLAPEKASRNWQLLQRELDGAVSEADRGRLFRYLAEAAEGMGNIGEAEHYAKLDIERGRQDTVYASSSYHLLLRVLAKSPQAAVWEERLKITESAVHDYPELPEFWAERAESLAYGLQYDEAVLSGKEALRAYQAWPEQIHLEPFSFTGEQADLLKGRMELWSRIIARIGRIKITALAMARNEAEEIAGWLDNALSYADEVVVCDTGSEDATTAIIKERQLKEGSRLRCCRIPWHDDFAAARNEALTYVSDADWVAFLDIDETFMEPKRVRPFLAEITVLHPEAEVVQVALSNVDADDGGAEIQRAMSLRFLRPSPQLEYKGRVHEQVIKKDGDLQLVQETVRLKIRHTGYSSRRIRKKSKRYLELMQKEIALQGLQPGHYRYLADAYAGLGGWSEALYFAGLAIDSPAKSLGMGADMYHLQLQALELLQRSLEERIEVLRKAVMAYPDLPDFHGAMGKALLEKGEMDKAGLELQKAVQLGVSRSSETIAESSHFAGQTAEVYAALARIALEKGELKTALHWSGQSLVLAPFDADALEVYAEAREEVPLPELMKELLAFFQDRQEALSYLRNWAETEGRLGLCELAGELLPEGHNQERQQLYKASQEGAPEVLAPYLRGQVLHQAEMLAAVLLRQEGETSENAKKLRKQASSLLPAAWQPVWRNFYLHFLAGEMPVPLLKEESMEKDAYCLWFKLVIHFGAEEQMLRAALLGKEAWGWQEVIERAGDLWNAGYYQLAWQVLMQVPSEEANAVFWLWAGKCLYRLGEYVTARECLEKVNAPALMMEAEAWQEWIREALHEQETHEA